MFLMSLKCTWIKRLTNNHKPWMDIFFEIHGSRVVEKLLDFGDEYVKTVMKHSNDFWYDVFQSWMSVMKKMDTNFTIQKLISVPVWYNTNLCVGNKSMYFKTWYMHGVKIIGDFLDEDGNFLLQQVFSQKFRLTDIQSSLVNPDTLVPSKIVRINEASG